MNISKQTILVCAFIAIGKISNAQFTTNPIRWGQGTETSELNGDQGGAMELGALNWTAGIGVPYIDFHYAGLTQDYNTRIINDGNNRLTFLNSTGPVLTILNSNIGIGYSAINPVAKLQVNEGSVLFNGFNGATPISGGGSRMMWIPSKKAFRAGRVVGSEWDDVNIGYYSFAACSGTKASGDASFAVGVSTVASGERSFVAGLANNVSGMNSAAFGIQNTCTSFGCFVIGTYNYNPPNANPTNWVATDPIFIIGNGYPTPSNAMTVLKNGQVGIGTDLINNTAGYKLSVNGSIRAKEIVVNTGWSDFVFDKNYKLKTLAEVETYIQENGHLPEIPSASTIECDGGNLGELVKLQMQKIEELTLYIIEQNKRIESLETQSKK